MIRLRFAEEKDLPLMLAWRNNPLISEQFYQQRGNLIDWDTHVQWFYDHQDIWLIMIAEEYLPPIIPFGYFKGRPIGVLSMGQLDHWEPDIGIYLEPSAWGKGHGTDLIRLALSWLDSKGYKHARATVLETNTRSRKMFERCGFVNSGDSRKGEILYRWFNQ